METKTFLSIVTVHFQDYARLKLTLESLLPKLQHTEVEWIVVDGGSAPDRSEDKELMSHVKHHACQYVTENDDGIYDAMNKGIKLSKGEYTLFLNAGDKFMTEFFPSSLKATLADSRPDMIWGRAQFQYPDESLGVKKLRGPKWLIYGMPICHQSVLFLNRRFKEMSYNLDYKIASDYDLLVRAVHLGAEVALIQDIISEYSTGGVSQQNHQLSLHEEGLVRVRNFSVPVILSNLLSFLKGLLWRLSNLSPAFNRTWRKRI